MTKKIQLTKPLKKLNNKKGLTLVELIVAVMILMIAVGASVGGLSMSYRSTMLGAEKDDAQSVAQRNCDIIMSCISTNVDKGVSSGKTVHEIISGMFTNPDSAHPEFKNGFKNNIVLDTRVSAYSQRTVPDPSGGAPINLKTYDPEQYSDIEQVTDESAVVGDSSVKKQYYTIDVSTRKLGSGTSTKTYSVYKITTYTYYSSDGYVSCEGEVNIEKP